MRQLSKTEVARRQLGTALSLFIEDADPVSVHSLACAGGEVADALAKQTGRTAFSQHAMECDPKLTAKHLAHLKNKYCNAFKHFADLNGKPRGDDELLNEFDDPHNDHILFIGWHDLMLATTAMPVEAQVFQAWYFSMYPEALDPDISTEQIDRVFPALNLMTRSAQKGKLRAVIKKTRQNRVVMNDPKTERRSLIIKSPHDPRKNQK